MRLGHLMGSGTLLLFLRRRRKPRAAGSRRVCHNAAKQGPLTVANIWRLCMRGWVVGRATHVAGRASA